MTAVVLHRASDGRPLVVAGPFIAEHVVVYGVDPNGRPVTRVMVSTATDRFVEVSETVEEIANLVDARRAT